MAKLENTKLPEDLESLRTLCQEQETKISMLESHLRSLKKMLFGPKTERRPLPVDSRQGILFAELEALLRQVENQAKPEPQEHKPRRRPKRRKEFPKDLPRVHTVCELAADERQCSCGSQLREMGRETSQFLERVEYTFVHEVDRLKYCCPDCHSGVLTAPAPERVLDKGLLGDSFLAHILVDRFVQHMPYHRQEKKFLSEGLDLSRTVLCQAVATASEFLKPVADALRKEVLASDYIKADETTISLQNSSRGGKRVAYFWVYLRPGEAVSFDFTESRSRDGPNEVLDGFQGYLQVDAYGGYNEICAREGVCRAGCWAHARRMFDRAKVNDPEFAQQALDQIGKLYALDRAVRHLSPEERNDYRNESMPALLDQFKGWLEAREIQVLPQGDLGKAIRYTRNQWPYLIAFLDDGRIDLDNNTAEQQIRHIVTGRKNWTNINNPESGQRAARIYSLAQTCKLLAVNVAAYFRDVLLRAKRGEDPATLTPSAWKKEQAERASSSLTPTHEPVPSP